MEQLKKLLNIDASEEKFTKRIQKPKNFNSVKDNVTLLENKNFMMDYLFLPTTKEKYKYLLVVVDLATDEFDMEPMRDKKPENIIEAIKDMKKRGYIEFKKNDGQSVRTDSGTEFKGAFHKWLFENSIFHRTSIPNRHIQTANVERLNGELGKLLNGFMNGQEIKLGKIFKEWTLVVPLIRKRLNVIRKKKLPDNIYTYIYPEWNGVQEIKTIKDKKDKKEKVYKLIEPKYKKGDLVYVALETPENALGQKQKGLFRNGDYRLTKEAHKINQVLYLHGKPYFRYIVNGYPNVSYQEAELKPATEQEETFKIKDFVGKRTVNNKIQYKVWYKGEKKAQAIWQTKEDLVEQGFEDELNDYDEEMAQKKTKKKK
jgi:hypothetical protein